ncbi:Peptidoglycan-binding protein, CsiV [Halopseudomonas litoralis]|uniref:Peptidoglycan-binding protein, CsiV n=1 Tax=Halopseudomonas litoralis TaxID=797277 RepID=A0A1H1RTI6_9GAMM|nr:CsiV family protein [Halopseudomonas litoralis]SDS39023.1 Peptidoglycan-binding protein, CsiV [Halopseudomonas litoralis]
MNPTRLVARLLMTLTLLACSALAQAQYLVEVLVFSQPGAQIVPGASPEYSWDQQAVSLDDTTRSDVRSIDRTRYRLDSQASKLESKGYTIRLHRAWTQPTESGLTVALHQGNSLTGSNADPLYPVQGLISLDGEPLTAKVTFWLNHASEAMAEPISERLQSTRRLRVNEVHYLDHNSMGLLIHISQP